MRHAVTFPTTSSNRQPQPAAKRLKPRDVVVRAAVAEILRQRDRLVTENTAAAIERIYSSCPATLAYVGRSLASPASSTVAGWAMELVQTAAGDFFASMAGQSAFAALAGRVLALRGVEPKKIVSRVHPFAVVGGWISEGAPIPVAQIGLAGTTMTPSKVACISTFTEEMASYSVLEIEAVVREALQHDLGALLDSTFLSTNAASGATPAGLLNGATAVTASALTPASEAMFADLGALTASIMTNAPDAVPVFLAHPRQAMRLSAAGVDDVISSGFMTAGSLAAVDAGSLAMLVDDVRFSSSNAAALHMDTAPSALSATGTPNVVSAPMASMFQIDAIALRSILWAAWQLRRTGAVARIATVAW